MHYNEEKTEKPKSVRFIFKNRSVSLGGKTVQPYFEAVEIPLFHQKEFFHTFLLLVKKPPLIFHTINRLVCEEIRP